MIKPILKIKKKRNQSIGYWQRKADKVLQDIGRIMYEKKGCLICGGVYSCLHHYVLKSNSTELRYNLKNCINICNKCHCNHHQHKDSTIHAQIDIIKGQEWIEEILMLKKQGIGKNYGYVWYREKYYELEQAKKLLTP